MEREFRRALFEGLVDIGGVPGPQLFQTLRGLTGPSSRACNGQSCAGSFGIRTDELRGFIADSDRAVQFHPTLSQSQSRQGQLLRASLAPLRDGGKWNLQNSSGDKVLADPVGSMTVYTYQLGRDFLEIVGKTPDVANPDEAQALAEALPLSKMEKDYFGVCRYPQKKRWLITRPDPSHCSKEKLKYQNVLKAETSASASDLYEKGPPWKAAPFRGGSQGSG